jgi:hypothetical protein
MHAENDGSLFACIYSRLAMNAQPDACQGQRHSRGGFSTYHFALDVPFSKYGKEERHCVYDRDSQAQFSLPDEQEKPHAASQVHQQRYRILWVPQQIHRGEEGAVQPRAEPAPPDGRRLEDRVRRRAVGAGGAADKGRGEAPRDADEDEAEDVVDDGGLWCVEFCHGCCCC